MSAAIPLCRRWVAWLEVHIGLRVGRSPSDVDFRPDRAVGGGRSHSTAEQRGRPQPMAWVYMGTADAAH